jgi:hypothetical protein
MKTKNEKRKGKKYNRIAEGEGKLDKTVRSREREEKEAVKKNNNSGRRDERCCRDGKEGKGNGEDKEKT